MLEPNKVYMPSYLQVNDDDDNKVSIMKACPCNVQRSFLQRSFSTAKFEKFIGKKK